MPEAQGLRPCQGSKGAIRLTSRDWKITLERLLSASLAGSSISLNFRNWCHRICGRARWEMVVGGRVGHGEAPEHFAKGASDPPGGRAGHRRTFPCLFRESFHPPPNHGMPPQPRREDQPAPKRRRLHSSQRGRWPRQELIRVDSHLDLLVAGRELPLLKGHRVVLDPLQKQADHTIVFLPAQLQLLSGEC